MTSSLPPTPPRSAAATLDLAGIAASVACAIHCAAMPLLVAAGSATGLAILADESVELALVGLSVALGVVSLVPAVLRRHRRLSPLITFAAGASAVLAARLVFEESEALELAGMAVGAGAIATAHWLNLRLCRHCPVC